MLANERGSNRFLAARSPTRASTTSGHPTMASDVPVNNRFNVRV